jgi:Helix-turn-helix domain/Probable transposase
MVMRYRYRIEPTSAQQAMLARVFGCCRVVFNDALRVREEAYRAGIKLSDSEIQRRVITQAKKTTERAWLCEVPSVALVQSVNDSRRAWRNFFDSTTGKRKGRKLGRPRMKSRKDHRQAFRLTRNGFCVRPSGRLFVAKVGEVRVRWSRDLPCEPSSVTIIREPDGHFYASFVLDVPASPLPPVEREAGVDVGLARLATIAATDGTRVDVANPKHLGRKLHKLARLEREKSRRQKGSANRDKSRRKVAIAHNKVAPCSARLSPQAGFGVGSREPSDPRRGPQHRGHGQKPSSGPRDLGCGVGPVRADRRREGRPLRAHRAHAAAVVGVEQDVLGLWASARRTAATGPAMDLPSLPGNPRQRPQRRQSHSRRRAGGETKRLRSPGKSSTDQEARDDETGSPPTAA